MIYLEWYRDKGRGQEACIALNASEEMVGFWPVARLKMANKDEADDKWNYLRENFQINAMTVMMIVK